MSTEDGTCPARFFFMPFATKRTLLVHARKAAMAFSCFHIESVEPEHPGTRSMELP